MGGDYLYSKNNSKGRAKGSSWKCHYKHIFLYNANLLCKKDLKYTVGKKFPSTNV